MPFQKNFQTRKLVKITVFYAVQNVAKSQNIINMIIVYLTHPYPRNIYFVAKIFS